MLRPKDLLASNLFIAAVATCIILIFSLLPNFEITERRMLDFSFVVRGAEKPHPDIVIIEINDESLRRIGSWPWPRSFHAALVKILREKNPKGIFFDVIFSEKSSPEDDLVLAHEMGEAGNIVLPFYFPATDRKNIIMRQEGLPIPGIREKARKLGYVNAFPDNDGHVRELPLTMTDKEGTRFMNSALALASLSREFTEKDLLFYDKKPTLINFPGPYEVFSAIPFEFLIAVHSETWAQGLLNSFKDKVVLVGHTATGTALDLKPSPFSPQYPGVALQASIVHTLLSGKHIVRVPRSILIPLLFGFAYLIIRSTTRYSPFRGLLYMLGALTIVFLLALCLFLYADIWFPYLTFMVIGPILYVLITLLQFLKVRVEREILNRELTLASRIQQNLLPAEMPEIPNIQISAFSLPAKHVGGDLYDVLTVAENKWGVCVGDVSGKGVPAALFMAKAISEFRRESDSLDTSVVISGLNNKLAEQGVGGLFLTLLYLILDLEDHSFSYSNGGHEPILHYQKKHNKVELLMTEEGLPLGIAPECAFDRKVQKWETGDVLILQSDGVKEAMNEKREIFGFERAMESLMESHDKSTDEIIQHLYQHILKFAGDAPQHDDTTIVCIKHL